MYAVYILMIRTARKAVPISEHTLYNYIRKLREVLSKDKEISITTQNNGYELHAQYSQPIITQYFTDNKSEIWSLSLIAHSKR